ncbi:RNA polymerase sigma-70 factor, ECF subfamily [Granulicella rosea]|uniref:RNA polymerase sigma-70 factor, ECF subfamily n=1 Tax=Granulicella rosea TaxID=474952 RepID=A0A239MJF9_9BACT|nr:sigma-70 family RNA polymerase sigma factor [Granulicella rosea]SNT42254.1 RNA polymerase sigma-70 factor, ECF subfamily [Granulicella rosea]
MDSAPAQDGLGEAPPSASPAERAGIPASAFAELWTLAEAGACELSEVEFGLALAASGARCRFGVPPAETVSPDRRMAFYRALHLKELALAQACALGRDIAWRRFLESYRSALTQAATGIAGSSALGEDLAGALYAELYGLKERNGERHSPLAGYSGRGSLMGWLRAILAQRHVDRHRRTHRESPLGDADFAAPPAATPASPAELTQLNQSVGRTLGRLQAEDRLLLASYFLDGRTLLELARLLRVHEATVSRRLKRLTGEIRKSLLKDLQAHGMSRRAAEERLGADPRDLDLNFDLNLRNILQTSPPTAFSQQAGKT